MLYITLYIPGSRSKNMHDQESVVLRGKLKQPVDSYRSYYITQRMWTQSEFSLEIPYALQVQ